ncbi:hypothetical protein U1Q18_037322, partial [Sarracenia purpurea var. burkii]
MDSQQQREATRRPRPPQEGEGGDFTVIFTVLLSFIAIVHRRKAEEMKIRKREGGR